MNIYQTARRSAGLTQEKAAELLNISVESLRAYESGKRFPPNTAVNDMVDIYQTPHLALQHLRMDPLASRLLPSNIQSRSLEQATIRLYRQVREFALNHRTDDLIDIAEDGVIDEKERPMFNEIMRELNEIVNTVYSLQYRRL